MKLKELQTKIRQVQSYAADTRSVTETADALETTSVPVSVMVGSVYCQVPAHSAIIMLRAEEKRLKEARAAVMAEINLEDDDE